MKTQLIGAALGIGAQNTQTQGAPEAFAAAAALSGLRQSGLLTESFPILRQLANGSRLAALPLIAEFNQRLAKLVLMTSGQGHFPVVLGGDHSVAVGTWSGIAQAQEQDLGLIWIDAHMDSHTPDSSESGAIHGMPLASLLGFGPSSLVNLGFVGPKLKPQNVCLIGIRSYESAEAKLLADLGVRVYFTDEVLRRGYFACFEEARQIVTQQTGHFGLTFDLDALDPAEFSAVGSPAPGGLSLQEVQVQLCRLAQDPKLCGLEIVEYNPQLDPSGRDAAKVMKLLRAFLDSLAKATAMTSPQLKTSLQNSQNYT